MMQIRNNTKKKTTHSQFIVGQQYVLVDDHLGVIYYLVEDIDRIASRILLSSMYFTIGKYGAITPKWYELQISGDSNEQVCVQGFNKQLFCLRA